ncbi:MAG: hypothetical protein A2170_09305 [Deltaproteobacteria bacterium RBG_13_53_10]|nr:MAG: hypothetical protein A2170_09305 [Deltaproteobacteria bacterium RBG_13_53_10]
MEDAGCDLILGRDGLDFPWDEYTEEELIQLCKGADAIIGGSRERYTRRLIESIPNLRILSKHGTGTDRIDIEAATERGVLVTHTPVNSAAVAEHTVALMLALMKRIREADRRIRQGGWRDNDLQASLIGGKTVGIVGFGRIGVELAKRLQGWDVVILAYDPYVGAETFVKCGVIRCTTLDEMLPQVDVLSLNAVLTRENRHMIGKEVFKRMKKTAYVVNTSRGEIIDESTLIDALKDGDIAGAALDVMEKEPPLQENELLRLDNTIVTPHMSAWTPEMNWKLTATAMENALAALQDEIPKYVKNPEVIARWRSRFVKK